MKNKIGLVILSGVLLVFGFVVFKYSNNNQQTDINQDEVATTTETVVIDTSDWETCRNEEYGYEFKYPSDWYMYSIFNGPDGYILKKDFVCAGPTVIFLPSKNSNESDFILKIYRQAYNWNQALDKYINTDKDSYGVDSARLENNGNIEILKYKKTDLYPEALFLNETTLFKMSLNSKSEEFEKIFNTILLTIEVIK